MLVVAGTLFDVPRLEAGKLVWMAVSMLAVTGSWEAGTLVWIEVLMLVWLGICWMKVELCRSITETVEAGKMT